MTISLYRTTTKAYIKFRSQIRSISYKIPFYSNPPISFSSGGGSVSFDFTFDQNRNASSSVPKKNFPEKMVEYIDKNKFLKDLQETLSNMATFSKFVMKIFSVYYILSFYYKIHTLQYIFRFSLVSTLSVDEQIKEDILSIAQSTLNFLNENPDLKSFFHDKPLRLMTIDEISVKTFKVNFSFNFSYIVEGNSGFGVIKLEASKVFERIELKSCTILHGKNLIHVFTLQNPILLLEGGKQIND